MEQNSLHAAVKEYEEQLEQVEVALSFAPEGEDKDNLKILQADLKQLIELTIGSIDQIGPSSSTSLKVDKSNKDELQDEYALFMAEMTKEGAIEVGENDKSHPNGSTEDIEEELKSLEGIKCRAPHKHTWGDIVFHNAIVCTVLSSLEEKNFNSIEVKIMFTNPTHQEMLPCPYLLESDCKFTEENCRYSHGEIVLFSQLEEYIEPNYEMLNVGSFVLAKKKDKLWHRATVKRLFKEKCLVKFDTINKEVEVDLTDIFPTNEGVLESEDSDAGEDDRDDLINMSLMITPSSEKIGGWEKFTNGIGSKLMEKMGYVIGTGLGKRSDGRVDPVTAVVLPAGKSLDHCMQLREKAGGDKDLFSVERKLKKLQRKQEITNQKNYDREKKKVDVFNFINSTLLNSSPVTDVSVSKSEHRQEIRKETSRNLNVESLKIDENIRDIERELFIINESLGRHKDVNLQVHKQLKFKLSLKQNELKHLHTKALNIKNEQNIRNDKKKLTIF